jgi:hypothetical protein
VKLNLDAVQSQLQDLQESYDVLSKAHVFLKEKLKPLLKEEFSKTRNLLKASKQDLLKVYFHHCWQISIFQEKADTLVVYSSIRQQFLSFTSDARDAIQRYRSEVEKRRMLFNMLEEIKGNIR